MRRQFGIHRVGPTRPDEHVVDVVLSPGATDEFLTGNHPFRNCSGRHTLTPESTSGGS